MDKHKTMKERKMISIDAVIAEIRNYAQKYRGGNLPPLEVIGFYALFPKKMRNSL